MRPGLLAGAILFRPLAPFTHDLPSHLDGTPVLIIDGAKDSRRSPGDGLRLAEWLTRAGATVTHHPLPAAIRSHPWIGRSHENGWRRCDAPASATVVRNRIILDNFKKDIPA
jgi:hypothetical protein